MCVVSARRYLEPGTSLCQSGRSNAVSTDHGNVRALLLAVTLNLR